jgi:hypothetical protein
MPMSLELLAAILMLTVFNTAADDEMEQLASNEDSPD